MYVIEPPVFYVHLNYVGTLELTIDEIARTSASKPSSPQKH